MAKHNSGSQSLVEKKFKLKKKSSICENARRKFWKFKNGKNWNVAKFSEEKQSLAMNLFISGQKATKTDKELGKQGRNLEQMGKSS